jgi:hypothetical protein
MKTPQDLAVEEIRRCHREREALAAENDQLRAWWFAHVGDVLELILAPTLDEWLRRAHAGANPEHLAREPQLEPRDVRYLLELWQLRHDIRRELERPAS